MARIQNAGKINTEREGMKKRLSVEKLGQQLAVSSRERYEWNPICEH